MRRTHNRSWIIGISLSLPVALGLLALRSVHSHRQARSPDHPQISFNSSSQSDPRALLAEANHLSWVFNWPAAGPLYARAEEQFHESGDVRDEIYAEVGRIRAQAETMSFDEISQVFGKELHNPVVEHDPELRLWCLAQKGYTDLEIDPASAKKAWTEALDIADRIGEKQWAARATGELGIISFLEGNSGKATSQVGHALLSAMTSGDLGAQVRYLEMFGNGFNEVHRYSESLRFFERAIKLASSDPDAGIPFMAYEGKSEALLALGKQADARQVLSGALAKARNLQRHGHEAQLLILLGKLEAQSGNREQAIQYLEQANDLATSLNFYRMLGDSNFELSKLYVSAGDLRSAEDSLHTAIAANRRVGDRYFLPRNLTALAELRVKIDQPSEAERLYEEAEDIIDGILINMHAAYWNTGLAEAMSATYLQHFALVANGGDVTKAFAVLERVRGRTAAAQLQNRTSVKAEPSPAVESLEQDISELQLQLLRSEKAETRAELLDKLLEYERRLAFTRNELDLTRHESLTKPATLAQVQHGLRNDELLLEYVLDSPQSFCLSISRTKASIVKIHSARGAVEALAQDYLSTTEARRIAAEPSQKLYSILLGSVPDVATKQRLVIVPDGKLNLLPFEALRGADGSYVMEQHIVSYAPSGTLLHVLRTSHRQHKPELPLLAIGDVSYQPEGNLIAGSSGSSGLRGRLLRGLADLAGVQLANLPHTREEVISVGKIAGENARLLLGSQATKIAFKSEPLADFKVLHLAVHAVADREYPDRAALVLGTTPGSSDDGLLQVREITGLQLNSDLVTLSACDTRLGKVHGEAGLSSLEEAFLVAGSKAVVASLWAVDDAYTAALMRQFYQHLAEHEDKASALTHAKRDMLQRYGKKISPFYWAAFVLVGEGASPISFGTQ